MRRRQGVSTFSTSRWRRSAGLRVRAGGPLPCRPSRCPSVHGCLQRSRNDPRIRLASLVAAHQARWARAADGGFDCSVLASRYGRLRQPLTMPSDETGNTEERQNARSPDTKADVVQPTGHIRQKPNAAPGPGPGPAPPRPAPPGVHASVGVAEATGGRVGMKKRRGRFRPRRLVRSQAKESWLGRARRGITPGDDATRRGQRGRGARGRPEPGCRRG